MSVKWNHDQKLTIKKKKSGKGFRPRLIQHFNVEWRRLYVAECMRVRVTSNKTKFPIATGETEFFENILWFGFFVLLTLFCFVVFSFSPKALKILWIRNNNTQENFEYFHSSYCRIIAKANAFFFSTWNKFVHYFMQLCEEALHFVLSWKFFFEIMDIFTSR